MAVIADEKDLCNLALVNLGAKTITALGDSTDRATACNTIYYDFEKARLTEYPWRFNMKKVALSENATAPINEYENAFDFPNDILAGPYAVFNSTGDDMPPIKNFEIFGQQLFTNEETIVIDYTADLAVTLWPAYFVDYFVAALTAELAFIITDQQNTAIYWRQVAYGLPSELGMGGKFGRARHLEAFYNTSQVIEDYSLINARQV